jgi:SulP family sulfate permease
MNAALSARGRIRYTGEMFHRDLVAGATVAAIAIPQAMAYALIAGVDPRFGLYSAIVVTFVASVFGSSSHLINGPTNAISLVVFAALVHFDNSLNAVQAMLLLALMVGVIQIVAALLKLGDLTRYVSDSVILGFMAGAGVLVAVGQCGNFLGAAKKGTGDQSPLVQLWATLTQGGPFNPHAIGLGVGTIIVVVILRRLIDRYRWPQMDMLLALLTAAVTAAIFGWSIPGAGDRTLVAVVGKVPAALPLFHVPGIHLAWVPHLLGSAVAVSFLGLLEALAVAKSIATYTRQPLDYNKQCLAEGISNLVGGFFQCLPGSGSLTRSSINFQSGAITRMSGIYSAIIVAAVVLLFGPYARFVPKSALAGLLFVTAARLIDWRRLAYAFRASRFDALLVLVTALTAIFVSVDASVLVGAACSALMFVPRVARLKMRELVVTHEGVVRERQRGEPRLDALLIYDLEGALFFGAAPELHRFLETLRKKIVQVQARCLVLRLRRTRNPDLVSIEQLEHFLHRTEKRGIPVLLAGVQPELAAILDQIGFHQWLPADRIYPEGGQPYSGTLRAVRHAYQLIGHHGPEAEPSGVEGEAEYSLVP